MEGAEKAAFDVFGLENRRKARVDEICFRFFLLFFLNLVDLCWSQRREF
jgi:hypothetical protein